MPARLLEEGDQSTHQLSSGAIDNLGNPEVQRTGNPEVQHSRDAVETTQRASDIALPPIVGGGHVLHWHQVLLPFGLLRMTTLLESCARGEEARVAAELERFKGLGQAVLEAELTATDDWASSSPLHWAAYAGSAPCVHMLVDAGAQHTARSRRDSSQPLHLAARYGHQAAAQALLEHGADVDALNTHGNTPLHECCAKVNSSDVIETLLRARASLEAYNDPVSEDRRMTPLLVAAEAGSLAAIRLLLQRGADPLAFVRGESVNPDAANRKTVRIDRSKLLVRSVMQALGASGGSGKSPAKSPSRSDSVLTRDSAGARHGKSPSLAAVVPLPEARTTPGREVTCDVPDRFRLSSQVASPVPDNRKRPPPWARAADFLGAIHHAPEEKDAAAQQDSGEPQIKLQAVHVALAKGNLLCVAELLESLWRAKGQARARNSCLAHRLTLKFLVRPSGTKSACGWQVGRDEVQVTPLDPVLAFSKLCDVWLSGRQPGVREAARLLGLIVLSCKHVELSATSSQAKLAKLGQARGCAETLLASKPLPPSQPRHPVLVALKLAVMASLEAGRHEVDGCRQKAARMLGLQALFECLALALLETTQLAADQMTQSQDSQWVASKVRYQPAAVFSFWLSSATPYAATKGLRLFISSSLVHSHVKGLYLPTADVDTAADDDAAPGSVLSVASRWLLLALVNLAWLPLLTVAPESWVVTRATQQRLAMQRGDQTTLVVAWLLPCGRAALRVTSALMLAGVLTLRVPSVSSVSNWDALLAPWAAALLESIATQIRHQRASVIGWLTDDFFNALESLTLLLLVGLGGCAAYDIITEQPEASELSVSLQSFAVLVAYTRLLEVSYIFPKAGPQLLTLQFLIGDLWHVSVSLLSPLLLAVACAFVVLKHGFTSQPIGLAVDGYLDVLRILIGATINSEPQDLQELPIDETSGKTIIVSSFLLAALFGLIVILLLLSMIVARFSLTFSNISDSIDAIYKLKFAQITVLYTAQLRGSQLAPQPFNLLRRAILTLYALFAAVACRRSTRAPPPPARRLSRMMSAQQDIDMAAARVGATAQIDMAVEVERFVQRATSHAKIFPEMLSELCASQEHRIVGEAGYNQMQVTMEQVDGLRLHVLKIQGQLDQLSHTGSRLVPLGRVPRSLSPHLS